MPSKPTGKPNGRPTKPIDWGEVDKLCAIHCTRKEIASIVGVHEETLEDRCKKEKGMTFALYFEEKSSHGKASLRRKQYQMALNGDRVMLIWLGKQYLNQAEKIDQNLQTKNHFVVELHDGREIHMGMGMTALDVQKGVANGKEDDKKDEKN